MAGYVYNPGESIKQDFQQAGSSLGNIFSQVIQQKQRDYTLAENTFANIEALKKDLNIYGQKSISSKANALLGNASSAILQNGKLDYNKIGEIRQAVSDIKDLKTGYDLGAKEYERMLQVGLANKDNLTSFEGFYKDLSAKMSDENLVKNPRDLQAALADTYTKSLDATKMFGKSYLASNPYQKVAYDVKDPKTGAMMRVQGELPAGWSIDAAGNRIPPKSVTVTNADGTTSVVDYADQTLAQLKATNPDTLAAMRRQAGFPGQNMSDKQLVEYYTTKIPMTSQTQQVSSADELKAKELAVKTAQVNLNYLPAEKALDMRYKQAMIDAANRKGITDKQAMLDYAQQNVYDDKLNLPMLDGKTKRELPVVGVSLGKNVKLTMNGQQALVTDVLKSKKTGDIWAKVLVDDKDSFLIDENNLQGAKFTYRKIKNPTNFIKELNQKIMVGGYAKKDVPFILSGLEGVLGAPSEGIKRGAKTIKSAAPTTQSTIYKGYNLDVLKSAPENKDATFEELKAAIDAQ
jgi:hypothetical protein